MCRQYFRVILIYVIAVGATSATENTNNETVTMTPLPTLATSIEEYHERNDTSFSYR